MLEIMPYPEVFSVYFSQKDQTIFISNQYQVASEGLAAFSPVASDAMLTTESHDVIYIRPPLAGPVTALPLLPSMPAENEKGR